MIKELLVLVSGSAVMAATVVVAIQYGRSLLGPQKKAQKALKEQLAGLGLHEAPCFLTGSLPWTGAALAFAAVDGRTIGFLWSEGYRMVPRRTMVFALPARRKHALAGVFPTLSVIGKTQQLAGISASLGKPFSTGDAVFDKAFFTHIGLNKGSVSARTYRGVFALPPALRTVLLSEARDTSFGYQGLYAMISWNRWSVTPSRLKMAMAVIAAFDRDADAVHDALEDIETGAG